MTRLEPRGHVVFTGARYPLVCVEFHGVIPDVEWERYLRQLQEIQDHAHARSDKLVLLIDATRATRPVTAHQRRLQADQIAQNAERDIVIGLVAVIDNALIRGALTALLWIQRFDWEYTVVEKRDEAERWALSCLARHGRGVDSK